MQFTTKSFLGGIFLAFLFSISSASTLTMHVNQACGKSFDTLQVDINRDPINNTTRIQQIDVPISGTVIFPSSLPRGTKVAILSKGLQNPAVRGQWVLAEDGKELPISCFTPPPSGQ